MYVYVYTYVFLNIYNVQIDIYIYIYHLTYSLDTVFSVISYSSIPSHGIELCITRKNFEHIGRLQHDKNAFYTYLCTLLYLYADMK